MPQYPKKINSSYHLFVVHLDFKNLEVTKDQLFSFLIKRKIFIQYHYIPQYYFKGLDNNLTKYRKFYGAEKFYNSALSLPIYPYLKNKEIIYILESIKKFISKK
jgi:dTDP-4-amino-4,6-dideoxygalactose transaminase